MKILICDYKDELDRDIDYEKRILREMIHDGNLEIEVYEYENEEKLINKLEGVQVLLTAFIDINKNILDKARDLQCISVNATGYGNIDIKYAAKKNITVCNVAEYCTQEVAEHVMALILSLSRNLKGYMKDVEERKRWTYITDKKVTRLEGQTLGIFGFGRIGQAVARRALGFGINVIAVDPYIKKEVAEKLNVKIVDKEYALKNSDIITNHMNQTEENKHFFGKEEFINMRKNPIFINAARGSAVDYNALLEALDKKVILRAGLDVLESENPNLDECKLLNRDDVIITPHAAFYSQKSMRELQRISCENIGYFVNGERDKIFRIVN